jgi:hybrid cluster-associated redox disulfide protein
MISVIAWIALLAAVAALAYAWKLSSELATATRRLDRYNKALFDLGDEVRRLREENAEALAQLRVELRRSTGTVAFTPDMTVREAQMLHPQSAQVMAAFHLGGCDHCAVEPDETLAQACAANGVDAQALIGQLNLLVAAGKNGNGAAPQPVKIPNMTLEI